MILLRSLLYFAAMTLSILVYGGILAGIGWMVSQRTNDSIANQWGRLNLWLQHHLCGLDFTISGLENLPDGAYLLMAKHQSAWETIALRGLLRPDQSWVLKRELMQIPVFGWALRRVKPIAIDRKAGRRAVLQVVEEGMARLQEGRIVIIFPEGTRTAPGQRRKYGLGGGLLAERSGVDVLPLAHNAGRFWRRRGVKKYPGTIQVVVGKPISSVGRKAADIMRDVEDWVETQQKIL